MEKRCRRARTCCQPTVRPLRLLPMALASTASQFIALPSSKNSRALSRQLTYPPHLQFGTARKGCPGQFAVIRGLAWPQLAQERGNGVPHAWQNLAASGTTAVQFGHSTLAPNTHDALVRPLPGQRMGNSLGESWSESPDGLTYEFKLRQGVKFHNG